VGARVIVGVGAIFLEGRGGVVMFVGGKGEAGHRGGATEVAPVVFVFLKVVRWQRQRKWVPDPDCR
jgi:hypothetical protein